MLRDTLRAAWRSVTSSKFYAAVNIAGLATGLAAAILLFLFVRDERTWDHYFPADTYRLSSAITMPGGVTVTFDGTDYVAAEGMRPDIPQVAVAARMMPQDWTVRHGEVEANETIYWADAALFQVLPMEAIAGDLATALTAPNAAVLTRTMAQKYFGQDAPLGQTLRLNRDHLLRVTAVIEDLPPNTHIAAQIFASGNTPFSNLAEMDARPPGFHFDASAFTYFRLRPGASLEQVRAALPDLVVRRLHIPRDNAFGVAVDLSAIPVRDIHFAPAGVNAMKAPGDEAAVWAAAIIALLILTAACVNFVNLKTARVSRRAMEVGVRKAAGASRPMLAAQFIAEALIEVAAAMVIALAAVELLLPWFGALLDRDIAFAYWQPGTAALLALAVLAIALLANAWPALLLSSLRPAVAMRGGPAFLDKGRLRRILVVVQFAILTGLVIATIIIWRQTQFAAASAARLSAHNMVLVAAPCSDGLRNGLVGLPGVEGVACAEPLMMGTDEPVEMIRLSPTSLHSFNTLSVDAGFLESFNLRPLAGRLFDRAQGGDLVAPPGPDGAQELRIVINQTAVHVLGLTDPQRAIGLRFTAAAYPQRSFTVIGVVPDLHTGPVRVPVPPTFYFADPSRFAMLSVRAAPGRTGDVTAGIRNLWVATAQPGLPKILPLDLYAAGLTKGIRRDGILLAAAAAVALFIACIGLFAMATFMAEQRTKEIGIRKALGATTRQVTSLLLWQFLRPVLWANLIAWPIVWWLMQSWLNGFAYHVPLDLWPFLAGAAFTLVLTLATVGGQAFSVARQPPVAALRYE